MSLENIAERYMGHLKSLERMMSYSEIIKNEYDKEKEDLSLMDIMSLILDVKAIEHSSNYSLDESDLEKKKMMQSLIEKMNLLILFITT